MLEKEYLQRMESGGVIVGLLGEKICNYFTFYAVFQDEETYKVLSKTGEIGTLDNCPALGEVFVLAGRSWVVISVDEERKSIYVNPTKSSRIPIWNGSGGNIHEKIFKRIKKVLQEDIIYTYLRPNAIQLLTDSRKAARESGILEHDIIQFSENTYHICPWTGTKELATISNLFSYGLKEQLDIRSVEGGFGYLTFRSGLEKKELINCLMNLKIDQNNPDMVLAKDAAPKKDKYDYMVPGNLLRSAYLYNQVDVKSANNILNNLVW